MDYDVALHNSRVFTDGGQIPDNITTDRYVRLLKQAGLWESCVFFGDTARGVKKDSNEFVSKIYDVKNNSDLIQPTGTSQPKYQTNGSLLFDGGDILQSDILISTNPIRTAVSNTTIIIWFKSPSSSASKYLFYRATSDGLNFPFILASGNGAGVYNRLRFIISADGLTTNWKQYISNVDYFDNNWHCATLAFSPNSLKCYIDGVEIAVTKLADATVNSLFNFNSYINIGNSTTYQYPLPNTAKVALPQIYNTTFTAEQVLWDFNNILPGGV